MNDLSASQESIAARAFGKGLALEEIAPGSSLGFDLVWAQGPNGRDLALVAGPENLAQDLKVAFLTPLGNDLFNVRFGFDGLRALTHPMDAGLVREFIRLSAVKTVGTDARIRQILNVELEPVVPEERRWEVRVEAQTILGESMALALGEVNLHG